MHKFSQVLVAAVLLSWGSATAQVVAHNGDVLTAQLRLSRGINLITLPVNPTLETTNDRFMMSDLIRLTQAAFVVAFEGGRFNTYLPALNKPDVIIDGGRGYVIGATASHVVTMHGLIWAPRTCTQQLSPGLNAIGFPRGVLDGMTTEILRSLIGVPYVMATTNGDFDPYVPGGNAVKPVGEAQAFLFSVPASRIVTLPMRWPAQKLVYTSVWHNEFHVFTAESDGSNATPLTTNPFFEDHGKWLSNGRDIAFTTSLDPVTGTSHNQYGICIWREATHRIESFFMPGDGRAIQRFDVLPTGEVVAEEAAFPAGGLNKLYLISANGASKQRITTFADDVDEETPFIEVKGHSVVLWFTSNESGHYQIHNMVLGTGITRQVTDDAGDNGSPVVISGGKILALGSTRNGLQQIYLLNIMKDLEKQITFNDVVDSPLAWSSDGEKLLSTTQLKNGNEVLVEYLPNQIDVVIQVSSSSAIADNGSYQPQLFP